MENLHRLEALRQTGLLDSLPEESFDRFTRLAAKLVSAEISLVSLVDKHRQFFKSQHGLTGALATARQTPLTHSFCKYVVQDGEPLLVCDARLDQRLKDNPSVTEMGVIAYLGIPLRTRDGMLLGSLCAIDTHPRNWSPSDQQSLADLAEAVASEIDLRERARLLKDSIAEIQHQESLRDDEIRMLVHDLRTPAGAVSSCLDLLEDEPMDVASPQGEVISLCREASENLLEMLRSILETDRSLRGEMNISKEPILVSRLLRTAFNLTRPSAEESNIRITVEHPIDELMLRVDTTKIERVLVNLVTNAIKFSPAGSEIHLGAEAARLGGSEAIRFFVEDGGPGVLDADKPGIFQKFKVGSAKRNRGEESFGIGLSFCKMVVEAHGGSIGVEDATPVGSRFYFVVPAEPLSADSAITRSPE